MARALRTDRERQPRILSCAAHQHRGGSRLNYLWLLIGAIAMGLIVWRYAPIGYREPVSVFNFPLGNPGIPPLRAVRAFPHLKFRQPVFLLAAPDTNDQLYVLEKKGRIMAFPHSAAAREATVFLDIQHRVESARHCGLLGMAFDPDFRRNGRFYVSYSAADPYQVVIASYDVAPGFIKADPTSEKRLLEIELHDPEHCGGMLQFGSDGMLYAAIGDGVLDDANDEEFAGKSQDLTSLCGKILRIDPRAGQSYKIPPDNPFIDDHANARGEIWAYGLRNPWRFSIDATTGALWVGDVGNIVAEEINIVSRGDNLGWDLYEGNQRSHKQQNPTRYAVRQPVVEILRPYRKSAIVGGYVYRGKSLPSMRGAYFYGDHIAGKIYALRYDGQRVQSNDEVSVVRRVSSFGVDADGELYAVSLNGHIFRFEEVRNPQSAARLPKQLSQTGLFRDSAALIPHEKLIPYDVISPLWSDGATKQRWIYLPDKARIHFHPTEPWSFPVGTVLVKHFEMAPWDRDSESPRRLETRVLLRHTSGWAGFTYRWNEAQTDASLQLNSLTEELAVRELQTGGARQVSYYYPSAIDCKRCHTAAAGIVLGVNTHQLNRDITHEGRSVSQLHLWNQRGWFTQDVGVVETYGAMIDPADERQPLDARARSYLAANCSQCHRGRGPTQFRMDMRFTTPSTEMQIIDVHAEVMGHEDTYLIKSGSKEQSQVWRRMRAHDHLRMPPLGSSRVDPLTHTLIGRWIDSQD